MKTTNKKLLAQYRKNCVAICPTCRKYCYHVDNFNCTVCRSAQQLSWIDTKNYGK